MTNCTRTPFIYLHAWLGAMQTCGMEEAVKEAQRHARARTHTRTADEESTHPARHTHTHREREKERERERESRAERAERRQWEPEVSIAAVRTKLQMWCRVW